MNMQINLYTVREFVLYIFMYIYLYIYIKINVNVYRNMNMNMNMDKIHDIFLYVYMFIHEHAHRHVLFPTRVVGASWPVQECRMSLKKKLDSNNYMMYICVRCT
jgi:hypothetical protein